MDDYATPYEAVLPLLPHLDGIRTFAEPCAGKGDLIRHLEYLANLDCCYRGDLATGQDALFLNSIDVVDADAIITNPPWTRQLLHPLIDRFMRLRPTWLLFDADWIHTRQAAGYLQHCATVVSVGRVKWIPDSKYTGKDNAAWYLFDHRHVAGPRFVGREEVAA
jgi:hypothetical protein